MCGRDRRPSIRGKRFGTIGSKSVRPNGGECELDKCHSRGDGRVGGRATRVTSGAKVRGNHVLEVDIAVVRGTQF